MLDAAALTAYGAVTSRFATLGEWGDTTLGMVTGNNNYFRTFARAR